MTSVQRINPCPPQSSEAVSAQGCTLGVLGASQSKATLKVASACVKKDMICLQLKKKNLA